MPNIEPLYIAIFIAIVIGVVWYFQHKKDKHAEEVGGTLRKKAEGDKRNAGVLSDNASVDEESVPVLTAADEDPEAAAGAAAAVSTQPLEETVSVPVQQPAEPVAQPVVSQDVLRAPTVQRRKPEVDPAVEAVINITPLDGSFDIRLLKQRIADIEAEPLLKDLVRVQCFDKVSGLWYDGADRVTECTQIYLSMLLANRSRCVDQPTASKFMIHAEQFAIELKGESETPDSNEMIQGAERIQRIIQAFDKRLCVKLVAAKDIGEEELDAAAKACGFVKESDRYQRYVPGISTAVFHILPPQALGNEIELSFEVPLMAPASDPLSQFFAIANDLCCRIDAVMTDASGNPIGSRAASRIESALKGMHNTMAEHGVPAGSRRACLIFSAD